MNEPTKKNYEVLVTAYARVLVIGAESREQAMEQAQWELHSGDFDFDGASVKSEVADSDVPNAKRHANAVVNNDEDEP